jgi:hypothetical protein
MSERAPIQSGVLFWVIYHSYTAVERDHECAITFDMALRDLLPHCTVSDLEALRWSLLPRIQKQVRSLDCYGTDSHAAASNILGHSIQRLESI